jgi:hypothetical protein
MERVAQRLMTEEQFSDLMETLVRLRRESNGRSAPQRRRLPPGSKELDKMA